MALYNGKILKVFRSQTIVSCEADRDKDIHQAHRKKKNRIILVLAMHFSHFFCYVKRKKKLNLKKNKKT